MANNFYETNAKKCKEIMKTRRQAPKGTMKDIITLIKCMECGDYTPAYQSKLYQKHSSEYCEYMEIISSTIFGR